jgi:hypothetical protein
LGYRNLREDEQFWFLSRQGGKDVKESLMDRVRWMEAESCEIQAWNLLPDTKATRSSALYLPAECGWGERIVSSPGLILPPGQYSYAIRLRTDQRPGLDSNIIAEVRFINSEGTDEEIAGSIIPIDAGFSGIDYRDATMKFTVRGWGRTYLRLNFGVTMACWLDGIAMVGLPADFDGYYNLIFPQPLVTSSICTSADLLVQKSDGLTPDAMVVNDAVSGQVVARWQMRPGLSGKYTVISLVELDDDLPSTFTWATINAEWRGKDGEKQRQLCELRIVDYHRWMGVPHLEYSRLDLPPNATLELTVNPGLPGNISLRKLWLTPAPMWSY